MFFFVKARGGGFFLVAFCFFFSVASAESLDSSERLSSKFAAKTLHDIAYELINYRSVTQTQLSQAMLMLISASELDPGARYISETILNASSIMEGDRFDEWINRAFVEYADDRADLEVTRRAVLHFLADLHSSEERQKKLGMLLSKVGGRNLALRSELATQIAILASEKADFTTAKNHLIDAWRDDPYNYRAFLKLDEILQNTTQVMSPAFYAKYLRLAMTSAPSDIDKALEFARYSENIGMHDIASDAYEYSANLYKHLNKTSNIPQAIYLPWALASYHSNHNKKDCLAILKQVRNSGSFDLMLESLAGRAAIKLGDSELAAEILENAAEIIEQELKKPNASSLEVSLNQAAWFYAFAWPDAQKTLFWANKAYSADPASDDAKSLLAYAFAGSDSDETQKQVMLETARDFLGHVAEPQNDETLLYKTSQVGAIAMACIQIAENKTMEAAETLEMAIGMDRYSIVAERAINLMAECGREYEPDDTGLMVANSMNIVFDGQVVPSFMPPQSILSAVLEFENAVIPYGRDMDASLIISNNWTQPLVVYDGGLFKGYIRVDARVRGDVNADIPELISKRIRPSSPITASNRAVIPLKLMTGSLGRILTAYPQADIEMEFKVYLDPVIEGGGNISTVLKPFGAYAARPATRMTQKLLMESLSKLSSQNFKHRIRTSGLIAGLFNEQFTNSGASRYYAYVPVEQKLLTSALKKSIADEDWQVRVEAMSSMLSFRPPVDYELTRAVSGNLEDTNWPVRLVAMYLLSRSQGGNFKGVLDWKAANDVNRNVRRLAVELGGKPQ